MKTTLKFLLVPVLAMVGIVFYIALTASKPKRTIQPEKGCVFMTVMGEQSSKGFDRFRSDENIQLAVRDGLQWLSKAQLPSGGYGAGSHSAQHIRDPHAVKGDPATTAIVGMALLRSGTTLEKGIHAQNLKKALDYILKTIESAANDDPFITEVRNTQIQSKLGQNIDAVLAAQFLSNVLDRDLKGMDRKRIARCLDICIARIQDGTDEHGKQRGAGWAGVLQSGMANSALESAQAVGVEVDEVVLERSKKYQKQNYNEEDGSVKTDEGAGIILYAVSGSVRASAKEARKAKADIKKAKAEGKIAQDAEVNAETLEEIGYVRGDAQKYGTAYKVYESAKKTAQRDDVLDGFGNNGGEEFLSYLQTGESMLVSKDEDWKNWYDDMSGRILKIQNEDGSWNGHHCITSPVFCTATSLLLLTVEEDITFLQKIGAEE
ncbi:hypothetical protein FVB32_10435 [Flagellimonas hymeniacidonis]|uniref:Squalene cyclase C-terminal domain-containing protein n=1 Tax=Flagellimonas hymeniacidonis TaxID=2603628 RepID=A0A5C8V275_9FLAO|nr:hypothetical protein [Flagellimonas hymeniacidonis]TXN35005.1 hypothetical protein FVB32_10435 [Flagellimonas hymeniacidonis]